MKFSDITLKYSCPAFIPDGMSMEKAYKINKKEDKFYFTDGEVEFESEMWFIKMLFCPNECGWDEVIFEDIKVVDKTK